MSHDIVRVKNLQLDTLTKIATSVRRSEQFDFDDIFVFITLQEIVSFRSTKPKLPIIRSAWVAELISSPVVIVTIVEFQFLVLVLTSNHHVKTYS